MSSSASNVLLISVDQWPAALLGVAGHPVIETPTLDALARNGTRYSRAYSEVPICIPARRSLMTGTTARRHGDRLFQPDMRMPNLPTMPAVFRAAGYQTFAVGKLHVYPPRARIGFDDALVVEEGRGQLGIVDDYELELADRGFVGQQFMHGMSNNEYSWRTWHLPEDCHVTNWVTRTMARTIKRRDPTRPAFWFASYTHPHPPLVPLVSYFDRYRSREMDHPQIGTWAKDRMPYALASVRNYYANLPPVQLDDVKRAYYALCTHIDHQIRILIGTLREEGVLDDTIIAFVSDHGELLGAHGLYAKRCMLEPSAAIPMIIVGTKRTPHVAEGYIDDRLVGLQDMMPTLLTLCGLPIPPTCDGIPAVGPQRREFFYAEAMEGALAARMIVSGRHKLIWYPAGNVFQLFDLVADPDELEDLSGDTRNRAVLPELQGTLIKQLYGADLELVRENTFVGMPAPELQRKSNRGLSGQRGVHFPPPPIDPNPGRVVGAS